MQTARTSPLGGVGSLLEEGLLLDDFFTDGAGLFGLAFASPRA